METETSVGAIVFKKESPTKFLILKRADNNIWEFAKGHPHIDETELDTLKRELNEELGVSRFSAIPNFRHPLSYISSRSVQRIMIFYLIHIDEEIVISQEHSEHKWITLAEVPQFFKYDDVFALLDKCEKVINGP